MVKVEISLLPGRERFSGVLADSRKARHQQGDREQKETDQLSHEQYYTFFP